MKKIIEMVTKAKTKDETRATDKNNLASESNPTPSKVNITQNTPEVTTPGAAKLSQTPSSTPTSRYDSWACLCQDTDRQYPTPDDCFNSINYARRPRNFTQESRAKTNPDCRTCKILESTGKH